MVQALIIRTWALEGTQTRPPCGPCRAATRAMARNVIPLAPRDGSRALRARRVAQHGAARTEAAAGRARRHARAPCDGVRVKHHTPRWRAWSDGLRARPRAAATGSYAARGRSALDQTEEQVLASLSSARSRCEAPTTSSLVRACEHITPFSSARARAQRRTLHRCQREGRASGVTAPTARSSSSFSAAGEDRAKVLPKSTQSWR